MNKHNLIPVLDQQKKRLFQIQGLSNLLLLSADDIYQSEDDLNGCCSLISDLIEEVKSNHNLIYKATRKLFIVRSALKGSEGQ